MGDSFDPKIDYYNVLGVSTDATGDSVRNAYIQLALKYHPDQAGNTEASLENFRQIQEAYSVLSKTTTRRTYDIARNIVAAPTYAAATSTRGPSVSGDNVLKGTAISRPASAWTGLREKYRHESWQKLSLSIKKAQRAYPAHTLPTPAGIITRFVLPTLLVVGLVSWRMNDMVGRPAVERFEEKNRELLQTLTHKH